MKKLGFGLMRLPRTDPDDPASIDIKQVCQMVDSFIEQGFTYFDTAWMYCAFRSESATKEFLVDRYPREAFKLATKLHARFVTCEDDRDRIFNEQLAKTGVDYFDYYLLHDMGRHHYDIYANNNCFDWIRDKKEKGLVKKIGFSFHDNAEFLDRLLTEYPFFDFVQLQINYLDWESEKVQSRKCYEVAVKHGMPVIVMEPVKGGSLAKVPEAVEKMFRSYAPEMSIPSWAIRFAAGLENVMVVLSGMSNMEQLLDNTSYMKDPKPLDEKEQELIKLAVGIINGENVIPCTSCAYCVDGCPMNIPINRYFSLYNSNIQRYKNEENYSELTESFGKPSDCIACGQCEEICPQHLPIIEDLKIVSEHFEKV